MNRRRFLRALGTGCATLAAAALARQAPGLPGPQTAPRTAPGRSQGLRGRVYRRVQDATLWIGHAGQPATVPIGRVVGLELELVDQDDGGGRG